MKRSFSLVAIVSHCLLVSGCSSDRTPNETSEYCGKSFCIHGVSPGDVTATQPLPDVRLHVMETEVGQVRLLELNHPDIDDLTQTRIRELTHLRAWGLSPTPEPEVLIFVGAKWPHWLIVGIEGDESKRRELIGLLQDLRITAVADNLPEVLPE